MSRSFDGTNDLIRLATGGASGFSGAGTFAALAKKGEDAVLDTLLTTRTSGNVYPCRYRYDAGNRYSMAAASTRQWNSTFVVVADGWHLFVITKASGTATPRGHRYFLGTGVWTHGNLSGTLANATTPGASGSIDLGEENGANDWNGLLAMAGLWSDDKSDAAVEALNLHVSAQNWVDSTPLACWQFNQASTSTPVEDLTGGGADETSITGTTVSADDPAGFTYLSTVTPRPRGHRIRRQAVHRAALW